jgi:hypothetical protein
VVVSEALINEKRRVDRKHWIWRVVDFSERTLSTYNDARPPRVWLVVLADSAIRSKDFNIAVESIWACKRVAVRKPADAFE